MPVWLRKTPRSMHVQPQAATTPKALKPEVVSGPQLEKLQLVRSALPVVAVVNEVSVRRKWAIFRQKQSEWTSFRQKEMQITLQSSVLHLMLS